MYWYGKEENKVYIGIGYGCRGLGFNKGQKDRQVKNIQSDIIPNKGYVKFDSGVIDLGCNRVAVKLKSCIKRCINES